MFYEKQKQILNVFFIKNIQITSKLSFFEEKTGTSGTFTKFSPIFLAFSLAV
jgi:hypothetical protein